MFRYDPETCRRLLRSTPSAREVSLLSEAGFDHPAAAAERLQRLPATDADCTELARSLPSILHGLHAAHAPDQALLNFERLVEAAPNRHALFAALAENPRQVEILFRLFVSSQFLTDILIRNPNSLSRLSQYQRLAEIKTPPQYLQEAEAAARGRTASDRLEALRRFQQWELLRIAACDTFHLMDLRTVTMQLSRLAESLVRCCLAVVADDLACAPDDFAVLAFGKLGGEELNYSSDIDLVFVAARESERYWKLGQKLISALHDATSLGFLYRVDMRLRPWGKSGPLVTTIDAFSDYLRRHARPWELQALLKARTIAGAQTVGNELLARSAEFVYAQPADEIRASVRDMLAAIRKSAASADALRAEVKTGPGGIRDIEFLTQCLQLLHGRENPAVRSRSTLDALIRLSDAEVILPGEFQHLSSAYVFQRSVEHSLQLMHNQQRSTLPRAPRELEYLAGRLDFDSAEQFLAHYGEHRRYVQDIVARRLEDPSKPEGSHRGAAGDVSRHFGAAAASYAEVFSPGDATRHLALLEQLGPEQLVATAAHPLGDGRWELSVAGFDQLGDLALICGLLFVRGFDIESGFVFTGADVVGAAVASSPLRRDGELRRKFVDVFRVKPHGGGADEQAWTCYEADLQTLFSLAANGRIAEAQGRLARQVGPALQDAQQRSQRFRPVEIAIENDRDPDLTVMLIRGEDAPGFLYELCNALSLSDVSIERMQIESTGRMVTDTLFVRAADGGKITDPRRLQELRAAIVLTRHFTHLLPGSANPEAALQHFRAMLNDLFTQPGWLEQLASLQQPKVLAALARLFGESDFLWEDFLRLQNAELLPLFTDVAALEEVRDKPRLLEDLRRELTSVQSSHDSRRVLNSFKDREMFRIDMRHILGRQQKFGVFSQELTSLAEAVCEAALEICSRELQARYGVPATESGEPCRLAACALGKFGGRELGFASDIELMFVYDANGRTTGPEPIDATEYFNRLVDLFRKTITARRQGIFEVDLRLRPYGAAGPAAVSLDSFQRYYDPDGPAWPFERQALVKLRPIAGDAALAARVVDLRNRCVYSGRPFDLAAMRGMRERQLREHVKAGVFNAKLSPGGLVDCEYFVQALQIQFGGGRPRLRATNTREAMQALESEGILPDRRPLRDAYRFLRRVIDALRMVRGDARDLTVPPPNSDQFVFLARRLGYGADCARLSADLERHTTVVRQHMAQLDSLLRTT